MGTTQIRGQDKRGKRGRGRASRTTTSNDRSSYVRQKDKAFHERSGRGNGGNSTARGRGRGHGSRRGTAIPEGPSNDDDEDVYDDSEDECHVIGDSDANTFDFDFEALHAEYHNNHQFESDDEAATNATIEQWYADPYERITPGQATHSHVYQQTLKRYWLVRRLPGCRNKNSMQARLTKMNNFRNPKEKPKDKTGWDFTPEPEDACSSHGPALEIVEDDNGLDGVGSDDDVSEEDGDYRHREQRPIIPSSTGVRYKSPELEADFDVNTYSVRDTDSFNASCPFTKDAYDALSRDQKLEVLEHRLRWIERVHSDSPRLQNHPSDIVEYEFDPDLWAKGVGGLATRLRTGGLGTRYGAHDVFRNQRYFTQGYKPLQTVVLWKYSTTINNGKHYVTTMVTDVSEADYVEVYTEDPTFGISYPPEVLSLQEASENTVNDAAPVDIATSDCDDSDSDVAPALESDPQKTFRNARKITKKQQARIEQMQEQKQREAFEKINTKVAQRIHRLRQFQAEADRRVHAARFYELLSLAESNEDIASRDIANLSQENLEMRLRKSKKKLQQLKKDRAAAAENLGRILGNRNQPPDSGLVSILTKQAMTDDMQEMIDTADDLVPSIEVQDPPSVVKDRAQPASVIATAVEQTGQSKMVDTIDEQTLQQKPKQNEDTQNATKLSKATTGMVSETSRVWKPPGRRTKKEMNANPQPDDIVDYKFKKMTREQMVREMALDEARAASMQQGLLASRTSAKEVDRLEGVFKTEQKGKKRARGDDDGADGADDADETAGPGRKKGKARHT